ncbi:MAG TPA: hypothetical protein VIK92_00745 [Thermaerobacter sp.]
MSGQASWSQHTARIMEAALLGLPGVISCHVEVDLAGKVREVHLLAGPGRAQAQLVRDVQSLMAISFDATVEPSIIQVTRVGAGEEYGDARLRLLRHRLETGDGRLAITVELGRGERVFRGEAQGARRPGAAFRLAALATAQAVVHALSRMIEIEVFAVQRVALGHLQAALVGITAGGGALAPQEFIGSAFIRADETEAACRAVLDAVNRLFALIERMVPGGTEVKSANV